MTIFTVTIRGGRPVLTVYLETDLGDGYKRYGYKRDGGGGANVNAARIAEVLRETFEEYKTARTVVQNVAEMEAIERARRA